ncbi:hypothetical protein [Pseudarthrobacter sulfonivorans]|nr:hypothetical protein [Pseudarthrobacter sulfonivorans]
MKRTKRLILAAAAAVGLAVAAASPAMAGIALTNHSEPVVG